MKDICEKTGLSRGGLYRHYESTEQIFLEIVNFLMGNQQNEFYKKMQKGTPAAEILCDVLTRYEKNVRPKFLFKYCNLWILQQSEYIQKW